MCVVMVIDVSLPDDIRVWRDFLSRDDRHQIFTKPHWSSEQITDPQKPTRSTVGVQCQVWSNTALRKWAPNQRKQHWRNACLAETQCRSSAKQHQSLKEWVHCTRWKSLSRARWPHPKPSYPTLTSSAIHRRPNEAIKRCPTNMTLSHVR